MPLASARFLSETAAATAPGPNKVSGRHAPGGCRGATGGNVIKLCLQSFSAAASASARLSKKVAAAGPPDMTAGNDGMPLTGAVCAADWG